MSRQSKNPASQASASNPILWCRKRISRALARKAEPSPCVASPSCTTRAFPIAAANGARSEKSSSAGSIERTATAWSRSHATRSAAGSVGGPFAGAGGAASAPAASRSP